MHSYIALNCYIAVLIIKGDIDMHASSNSISTRQTDQVFMFTIRNDSVTRAMVTIFAEDLDVAWSRVRALFPGSDLSETEVQHAGQD